MKIIEVNEGPKIDYSVRSTKITFDDELMLNLAKYEQDDPVSIDICADVNGNLTTTVSKRYVSQIEIPARQYIEKEIDNPDYNPDDESSQEHIVVREAVPFSMDNVTLKLYSLE